MNTKIGAAQPLTDAEIIVQAPASVKNATDTITFARWVEERTRAALATHPAPVAPIPMLLHCPKCGTQHVDAPEPNQKWGAPQPTPKEPTP